MKSRYIKIPYTPSIAATVRSSPNKDTFFLRRELIQYAMQFENKFYEDGGVSPTKGDDCSGFIQTIFKAKSMFLPRTIRLQAKSGRVIPMNQIQPGDLIFYRRFGVINHVALYIGQEKVIHFDRPKTVIIVSNYDYREPSKAVTYFDL